MPGEIWYQICVCCSTLHIHYDYGALNQGIVNSQNSRRLSTPEYNISTMPVGGDVLLVPQCSQDLVYNSNNVPLVNFHHYERLQQKVLHEVDTFVLIMSRSVSSEFISLFMVCVIESVKVVLVENEFHRDQNVNEIIFFTSYCFWVVSFFPLAQQNDGLPLPLFS